MIFTFTLNALVLMFLLWAFYPLYRVRSLKQISSKMIYRLEVETFINLRPKTPIKTRVYTGNTHIGWYEEATGTVASDLKNARLYRLFAVAKMLQEVDSNEGK